MDNEKAALAQVKTEYSIKHHLIVNSEILRMIYEIMKLSLIPQSTSLKIEGSWTPFQI